MNTPFHSAAIAGTLPRLPSPLAEAVHAVRAFAQRAAAWRRARRRAAEDRDALARMSDRDLHDIGIDRSSLNDVANGTWTRDYPH